MREFIVFEEVLKLWELIVELGKHKLVGRSVA